MAVLQIDGTAVGNNTTRNNRGVVRHAGTIADGILTNKTLGVQMNDNDYRVYQSTATGAGKILSGGNFGLMTVEKYVIRRVTTELAGVANTNLLSGGSDFGNRHAIHKNERMVSTFLKTLQWDVTSSEAPTYTLTKSNQDVTLNNDEAARPSLATPGELVYRNGKPQPVQADYEVKNVG